MYESIKKFGILPLSILRYFIARTCVFWFNFFLLGGGVHFDMNSNFKVDFNSDSAQFRFSITMFVMIRILQLSVGTSARHGAIVIQTQGQSPGHCR